MKFQRAFLALLFGGLMVMLGCSLLSRVARSSGRQMDHQPSRWPLSTSGEIAPAAITPTNVTRSDYLTLGRTVLRNILENHFDCDLGNWTSYIYPQDEGQVIYADGSEIFMAAAGYITATGETSLGGCDLLQTMWNIVAFMDANPPPHLPYQAGISCAKVMWGLQSLGGPTPQNPFWASLNDTQRAQFIDWVSRNKDWEPTGANNMYLFRAATRYLYYAWGWGDTLADATSDQQQYLSYVTDKGWLYDGVSGINDYSIYSFFGASLNYSLNQFRVLYGDEPVEPEKSQVHIEAMLQYFKLTGAANREPTPWSRSNGLYGAGEWLTLPEAAISGGMASGVERGMYKRLAHLYYRWLADFWFDGQYFNPYRDPTGVEWYENSLNSNGQTVATLFQAYQAAEDTEDVVEIAIPAETMSYDLTFRFGHTDPTYGVRVVNYPAGTPGDSFIEKPAYSDDFTPPTVGITTPTDGQAVLSPVQVTWTGEDVAFYTVYLSDVVRAITTAQTIVLPLSPGVYTVTVEAADGSLNMAQDTVSFEVVTELELPERIYLPMIMKSYTG